MSKRAERSAAERTELLFELGPEEPVADLEDYFHDGTFLRLVRWDGEKRPCIVRVESSAVKKLDDVAKLSTLCGLPCKEIASVSVTSPPSGVYCQACLGQAGRGALR